MKCISCEIEINPQWKHAIDINVCPFCGKHIMEEHLKNLLTDLCDTMEKMKQYPDQLNDWMLSNHNYIKTDSPDIHRYMPKEMVKELAKGKEYEDFLARKNKTVVEKVKLENGEEEEVQVTKIQSDEKTNQFFDRAEAGKFADKTQQLKNKVEQIKKLGATMLTSEAGSGGFMSAEQLESADSEAVAEMQAMLSGGPAEITSALPESDEEEIPSVVLAMGNMVKGSGKNNNDLIKLQQMQNRVAQARKSFEDGSNRGSKGGGFSRSG